MLLFDSLKVDKWPMTLNFVNVYHALLPNVEILCLTSLTEGWTWLDIAEKCWFLALWKPIPWEIMNPQFGVLRITTTLCYHMWKFSVLPAWGFLALEKTTCLKKKMYSSLKIVLVVTTLCYQMWKFSVFPAWWLNETGHYFKNVVFGPYKTNFLRNNGLNNPLVRGL